jgi:hypothetical protein
VTWDLKPSLRPRLFSLSHTAHRARWSTAWNSSSILLNNSTIAPRKAEGKEKGDEEEEEEDAR